MEPRELVCLFSNKAISVISIGLVISVHHQLQNKYAFSEIVKYCFFIFCRMHQLISSLLSFKMKTSVVIGMNLYETLNLLQGYCINDKDKSFLHNYSACRELLEIL